MGRAAIELDVVTSALSQQISRLENELTVRLLQRVKNGVSPTSAGLAFWHRAQLALRNVEDAARAAGRLSGHVSIGLAPSTSGIVAIPFFQAMRERHPDVSMGLVETLSGSRESMLTARPIDLSILFGGPRKKRLISIPLNRETFAISASESALTADAKVLTIRERDERPLILPSNRHGPGVLIDAAFAKANCRMNVVADIDGLATLMEVVGAGLGVTLQPDAALARCHATSLTSYRSIVRT